MGSFGMLPKLGSSRVVLLKTNNFWVRLVFAEEQVAGSFGAAGCGGPWKNTGGGTGAVGFVWENPSSRLALGETVRLGVGIPSQFQVTP